MKWSSFDAENKSPQVLLGFKAHFYLQRPLISRECVLCKHISCAVWLQCAADDSTSFLPFFCALQSRGQCTPSVLCSLQNLKRASFVPHHKHLWSHPTSSFIIYHSTSCLLLEQGAENREGFLQVYLLQPELWIWGLGILYRRIPLNKSSFILKREQSWKRHYKALTYTLTSLLVMDREISTGNPDCSSRQFWTADRNLALSICVH